MPAQYLTERAAEVLTDAAMSYSILRRWNLDIKLGWRLASGFFDRVAQRSRAPVVRIEIFAHALLWNFNAAALKSVIGLHSHVLYYYRYHQYRMLRPQVRATPSCLLKYLVVMADERTLKTLSSWILYTYSYSSDRVQYEPASNAGIGR